MANREVEVLRELINYSFGTRMPLRGTTSDKARDSEPPGADVLRERHVVMLFFTVRTFQSSLALFPSAPQRLQVNYACPFHFKKQQWQPAASLFNPNWKFRLINMLNEGVGWPVQILLGGLTWDLFGGGGRLISTLRIPITKGGIRYF